MAKRSRAKEFKPASKKTNFQNVNTPAKGKHNDPWDDDYVGYGGGYGYGGTTYGKKDCHTEHHPVFAVNGTAFHLGRYAAVGEKKHDLVLDLADGVKPAVNIANPTPGLAAFAAKYATTVMKISWPDMGIPKWTKEMWTDLVAAIIADKAIKSVYICCMGGHGRTGTAAAIIGSMLHVIPENECPVEWLRTTYCKSVVESASQLTYIEDMTGRKVKAQAAKGYYGGSTTTTGKAWDSPADASWSPGEYCGEFFDPKTLKPTMKEFADQIYRP